MLYSSLNPAWGRMRTQVEDAKRESVFRIAKTIQAHDKIQWGEALRRAERMKRAEAQKEKTMSEGQVIPAQNVKAAQNKYLERLKQKFFPGAGDQHRANGLVAVMTGEFRAPKAGEWFISGAIPEAYFAGTDYPDMMHYYIAKLIDPNAPELPSEGWAICRSGRGEEMDLRRVRVLGQDSPPYLAGKIRYKVELLDEKSDPRQPARHVLYDRFFTDEKIAAKAYCTLLLFKVDELQNKVRKLRERTGV